MRKRKESHIIWNKHNPHDKIGRGNYKDVIHHIDGNPNNNDISNLQKMTFSDHMSLHMKGNTKHLNRKSYKHTEESKGKLSIAHTGKKHSLEHRRKVSEAGKGRVFSEETRKKISEAHKGKYFRKGYRHSEETKRKMSESAKRRYANA